MALNGSVLAICGVREYKIFTRGVYSLQSSHTIWRLSVQQHANIFPARASLAHEAATRRISRSSGVT